MTNLAKYGILNGENVIGIVYESDKYGRTLVLREKIDPNFSLKICTWDGHNVEDVDLMEFIYSLLPK